MKKLLSGLVLALVLGGCTIRNPPCCGTDPTPPPGPTPTPTPTPGPTPTPTPIPPDPGNALFLKTQGTKFVNLSGEPVDVHGFNSCCWSEDPEPSPDWSLVSKEYIDYLLANGYGPNILIHMRLGPWFPGKWFPSKLQSVGGPYAGGPLADLNNWNAGYWAYIEELISYGRSKNVRFEIDFIDGWACKQDPGFWAREDMADYHPWLPQNNIQGLDAYAQCGKVEIRAGGDTINKVYENWVRKVVEHAFKYDNVIGQDGNEILLVSGYTQAWTGGLINVAHDEESRRGYTRHLFGTNAPETTAVIDQVDFVNVHTQYPMSAAGCNTTTKPCRNNEYNPNPPFSSTYMQTLYCDAKSKGLYFDFWRHGMSLTEALASWRLMSQPCGSTVTGCSDIPNEGAIEIDKPPSMYTTEINAVLVDLVGSTNGPIEQQQKDFLLKFAQRFREKYPNLCAGVQSDNHGLVDEVCVGTRDLCQGYHVFNCKTVSCPPERPDCGCDSGTAKPAPNSANDAWQRAGTLAGMKMLKSGKVNRRQKPPETIRKSPFAKRKPKK